MSLKGENGYWAYKRYINLLQEGKIKEAEEFKEQWEKDNE